MSAAQDEFDTLFADKDRPSKHPEDEVAAASSETEDQAPEAYDEKDDDDSEEPQQSSMRSRYYLPKLRSQANTGPKGVIADAQAFEQARRAQRRSLMRSKETAAPAQAYPALDGAYTPEEQSSDDDDDDDDFMEQWRQSRLRELQQRRMKSRSRTTSPGKRTYGSLTKVDAEGYLDAIEKVQTDTVVVVLIYDDTSEVSAVVEHCIRDLARQHATTRFVKLHYEDAEMEVAGVPALLAYRGGDKFAGLVPVVDEIPDDAELNAATLGKVLQKHNVL